LGELAGEDHFIRDQRDAGDCGYAVFVIGRALLDPAQEGLVEFGIVLEAAASGVRDHAGGLHEEQALFWGSEIDAAADDLLGEAVVIASGIVAEEREMEAVFTDRGSVATAAVAAGAEEDRHHVQAEADGWAGGRWYRGFGGAGCDEGRGDQYEEQVLHLFSLIYSPMQLLFWWGL
jgi:hypothetical protein